MSSSFFLIVQQELPLPRPQTTKWLILLFTTILFAVIAVVIPGLHKQSAQPRAHNALKLLNETLARSQLAFSTYFYALIVGARFSQNLTWITDLLYFFFILTALLLYPVGVYLAIHQDRAIAVHHTCKTKNCDHMLPRSLVAKLCVPQIVLALLSLTAAVTVTIQVR